ncbi:hypothetical protein VP01_711g3 [Puccinia sorghi]|uniref:Uncharacterized protein n=1 Tax=Puccinia sorghi TaxID=27349 RepID=A0A0L6UEC3_9BASI|nr:hypothetical protein VP01_711g3 [Puccinia sorghi]
MKNNLNFKKFNPQLTLAAQASKVHPIPGDVGRLSGSSLTRINVISHHHQQLLIVDQRVVVLLSVQVATDWLQIINNFIIISSLLNIRLFSGSIYSHYILQVWLTSLNWGYAVAGSNKWFSVGGWTHSLAYRINISLLNLNVSKNLLTKALCEPVYINSHEYGGENLILLYLSRCCASELAHSISFKKQELWSSQPKPTSGLASPEECIGLSPAMSLCRSQGTKPSHSTNYQERGLRSHSLWGHRLALISWERIFPSFNLSFNLKPLFTSCIKQYLSFHYLYFNYQEGAFVTTITGGKGKSCPKTKTAHVGVLKYGSSTPFRKHSHGVPAPPPRCEIYMTDVTYTMRDKKITLHAPPEPSHIHLHPGCTGQGLDLQHRAQRPQTQLLGSLAAGVVVELRGELSPSSFGKNYHLATTSFFGQAAGKQCLHTCSKRALERQIIIMLCVRVHSPIRGRVAHLRVSIGFINMVYKKHPLSAHGRSMIRRGEKGGRARRGGDGGSGKERRGGWIKKGI